MAATNVELDREWLDIHLLKSTVFDQCMQGVGKVSTRLREGLLSHEKEAPSGEDVL